MCPQKNNIAESISQIRKDPNYKTKETCNVVCDEEWSDTEGTYDPTIKLQNSDVIRVDRKLMPKAERKAFAESERIRLNTIRNQQNK